MKIYYGYLVNIYARDCEGNALCGLLESERGALRVLRVGQRHCRGNLPLGQPEIDYGISDRRARAVVDQMHKPAAGLFCQFGTQARWRGYRK